MNELELIQAAQAGDNGAKTELLRLHHGFIVSRVKRHCRNPQDAGDYLSVGQMGFLKGVEKFDASNGCSLLGYARHWIDQNLRRYRDEDHTVRPAYNRGSRIKRREHLGEYDGSKLDNRRSELDQQFASATFSLNAPLCDNGEDLIDCIPSIIATPEDNVLESERLRILKERMCGMPAREVLTLLRGDDKTLAQVGKRFGCSRERIRQIEVAGMGKMRAAYAGDCQ